MKHKTKGVGILTILFLVTFLWSSMALASVITFEDLTPTTPYYGPDHQIHGYYWKGVDQSGGFVSGDVWFTNKCDTWYGFWQGGWAYSNVKDTTSASYGNLYSAITGGGVNGSSNYGVAYLGSLGTDHAQIHFGYNSGNHEQPVLGAYVTNTTLAYLTMKNGGGYNTKKFGGEDGTDPDWYKLTIYGLDSNYERIMDKYVEFYLADYRFDDPSQDYIVDDWTWVDLSSLGSVYGLEFEVSASAFTPAYFAMDNLTIGTAAPVPIPGAVWLLGSGLIGLICMRRKPLNV